MSDEEEVMSPGSRHGSIAEEGKRGSIASQRGSIAEGGKRASVAGKGRQSIVEETEEKKMAPPEDSGPTEAELAMQKRRQELSEKGLNEDYAEILEQARLERERDEEEIQELREKRERRKQERLEEERDMKARREEEEARRKQEEEERRLKKEEMERERREKREAQMKEFAKYSNEGKPNFVIIKRSSELVGGSQDEESPESSNKMSREQLEQERKAILAQRIQPLEISGFDQAKLADKAKSFHREILRLEGERYDLEKRFKEQQYDMLEMAERARQINKVGKTGLKRVTLRDDERDQIQEKYSGAPAKIEMYSRFERQQDKRDYGEKHVVFQGPTYLYPAERIIPNKVILWDENTGLPMYEELPGGEGGGHHEEQYVEEHHQEE